MVRLKPSLTILYNLLKMFHNRLNVDLNSQRFIFSDDCVLQSVPKKTTKSPTRRIYKLSQKQIPACENGLVAKGEGNITNSTRSTRTRRYRSSRKSETSDLRSRSTNIDTVGYDPYERYLDLTSQHRDRFMRIMENMIWGMKEYVVKKLCKN